MSKEKQTFKQAISMRWIKADSGNTYLCPLSAWNQLTSRSEEELSSLCVEESSNPQND